MKTFRAVTQDIRTCHAGIKRVALISGFFLLIVVLVHWQAHIPLGDLTRDPAAIKNFPFYLGFLSYTGILCCCAATAICFFSAHLIVTRDRSSGMRPFLLASGWLSLLLTLDDLFMLHEQVFPEYLGVPDKVVYGAYLAIGGLYLIRFRRDILHSDYPLLGCALLFLGASAILDAVPLPDINPFLFEDGSKFIGFISWLTYFANTAGNALRTPADQTPL